MSSPISEAIQRLQQIFEEHNLKNFESLSYKLTKEQRKHLDRNVYAWFVGYQEGFVETLRELHGLNLCLGFDKKSRQYPKHSALETIVKKLLLLSNYPVILVPKFRPPGCRGELIPTSWYELLFDLWPLVTSRSLSVLPRGITRLVDKNQIEGESFILIRKPDVVEKNWFLLDQKIPSLKIIDMSKERLINQMMEVDSKQKNLPAENVHIYLPHLRGVPIDTLVSLRLNHGDIFALYNSTMESFFLDSAKATTEAKLLDAMRKTDQELRRIKTEFEKLSKSKVLQASGVVVKLSIGVLCAFVPGELGKIGSVIAGGGAINDVLAFFRTEIDRKTLVSENPFYFPWMICQSSKPDVPNLTNIVI